MALRAIFLVALAAFMFVGILIADDVPLLTGSDEMTADVLSKSDAVFVGEITDPGKLDTKMGGAGYEHYSWVKMKVLQVLKGTVDPQIQVNLVTLKAPINVEELPPKIGSSYIFFVQRFYRDKELLQIRKLLPATDDNIATVKKLLVKPVK